MIPGVAPLRFAAAGTGVGGRPNLWPRYAPPIGRFCGAAPIAGGLPSQAGGELGAREPGGASQCLSSARAARGRGMAAALANAKHAYLSGKPTLRNEHKKHYRTLEAGRFCGSSCRALACLPAASMAIGIAVSYNFEAGLRLRRRQASFRSSSTPNAPRRTFR